MKDELVYSLYTELRDAGYVKMYDDVKSKFVMWVAETRNRPKSKELVMERIKGLKDFQIPKSYISFIESELRDTDSIRYHIVPLDNIMIHYFVIDNDSLIGRNPDMPEITSAFTRMCLNESEKPVDDSADDVEEKDPWYKMFAVIMLGAKSPEFEDSTNNPIGFTMKHELAHVVLKYVNDVVYPGVLDKYVGEDKFTEDEMKLFIEFLCDFTQFDIPVINKYSGNPIGRFSDVAEVLFKPERVEQYAPILKAISKYFA